MASKVLSLCAFFLFCVCYLPQLGFSRATSDGKLIPIEDHIRQMGYPVETHHIQTEDGYILTYHRIPSGKLRRANMTRPPVLVQHGVLAVSRVWAVVADSLGFVLADAGYDVWLANSRGTYYSRKHIHYDPDKNKTLFWDFSWHEMGYYDLPAAIDYILNTTGHSQLSFIGHSMGTTMYFVMGATRPEYMSKTKVAALMAPVAYIKNMDSYIFNFMHFFRLPLQEYTKVMKSYEFLPYSNFFYWAIHHICGPRPTQFLCRDLIGDIVGFDNQQLDPALLTTYIEFMPGGTSTKAVIHYGQIIDKEFRQFDYGVKGNREKYNSVRPPKYNLQNVNAPVYFFMAANDHIVSPDVVLHTGHKLPNLQAFKLVDLIDFDHGDFMWAADVKSLVYDDVLETINKYN